MCVAARCPLSTITLLNTHAAPLLVGMHHAFRRDDRNVVSCTVVCITVCMTLCKGVSPRPNNLCISKLLRAPWRDALLVIVKSSKRVTQHSECHIVEPPTQTRAPRGCRYDTSDVWA